MIQFVGRAVDALRTVGALPVVAALRRLMLLSAWLVATAHAAEPAAGPTSVPPETAATESYRGQRARPLDDARMRELKAFLAESMSQLGIPGVSYAVLDASGSFYEGGLGLRRLKQPDLVDADTLFMIGRNTTPLTTLLLAELVDAGRTNWDQPVVQIYPAFKLGDAAATRTFSLQQLICACTVMLPRPSLEPLFQFGKFTPTSVVSSLARMWPLTAADAQFQFREELVSTAGYLAGALQYSHFAPVRAYEMAMQDRVFAPLRMKNSTFDSARAGQANHAEPHGYDVEGAPALAERALDGVVLPFRPATGLWSSARELSYYVRLELTQGRLANGRYLLSAKTLLQRRQRRVIDDAQHAYGLGLAVDTLWGVAILHHGGGGAPGYESDIFVLPELGVGAVLLTNSSSGAQLLQPFLRRLLELLFDAPNRATAQVTVLAAQQRSDATRLRETLTVPAADAPAAALSQHYRNDVLGDILVQRGPRATVFGFGEWSSPVASRSNSDGTISFVTLAPAVDHFEFVVGARAGRKTLTLRDNQRVHVFTEIP